MAGRGPSADRSHDSRYNFPLTPARCRSSWCHYSRRLCELEQIGQSARITRPKTLLIWRRLPRPRSPSCSAPENHIGGGAEDLHAMGKHTLNRLTSGHPQHANKDVFGRRRGGKQWESP